MSEAARSVLLRLFGYPEFRGEQEAIVDTLVAGRNAVVLLPTGGGKSLCYQIPAILRPGTGIVVSPLIALGTTTIWWPARAHFATRLATLRMRSVEPIDVPPYL